MDARPFSIEPLEPRRLLSAGQLDPSFGTGGNVILPSDLATFYAGAAVVRSDGKVLLGGEGGVVRLDADGSIDRSYGVNGRANPGISVFAEVLQPDGKLLLGGSL